MLCCIKLVKDADVVEVTKETTFVQFDGTPTLVSLQRKTRLNVVVVVYIIMVKLVV